MLLMLIAATLVAYSQLAAAGVGCGRQASGKEINLSKTRVINGQDAKQNSWPWIISQESGSSHFCGGTLLRVREDVEASDIVLTAAHCTFKIEKPEFNAYAGLHWQSYKFGVEKRKVIKAKWHESYVNFLTYDIALLKLDKPINFTDVIRPICLAKKGDALPVGKQCYSAGWGRVNKDNLVAADLLQQLDTPVHDNEQCAKIWGKEFSKEGHLCAGPLDGSAATCNGDSGGVLACRESDGRWVQHGIVSYGTGDTCVWNGFPPVFTRVSNYADWIQSTMKQLSSLA